MSETLRWSTYEVIEDQVKFLTQTEGLSEDKARESAYADEDIITWAWEDLCDCLTGLMKRINKHDRTWGAEVSGFGWRGQSGVATFRAEDGEALLQKVLPDTDCTFTMYFDFRKHLITINNAHHDKPMGGEMYYIRPLTLKEEAQL